MRTKVMRAALAAAVGMTATPIGLAAPLPGMSQTFTVPIAVGRSDGRCRMQVHPLTVD